MCICVIRVRLKIRLFSEITVFLVGLRQISCSFLVSWRDDYFSNTNCTNCTNMAGAQKIRKISKITAFLVGLRQFSCSLLNPCNPCNPLFLIIEINVNNMNCNIKTEYG